MNGSSQTDSTESASSSPLTIFLASANIEVVGVVPGRRRDRPRVPIVDEQRFCQCKRAATLSVPPLPSEDAAAPFRRPGTPLART